MTVTNLNDICSQGSFPNAYIYHICGMPWASTNNIEFYNWITDTVSPDTGQLALKSKMFGYDYANVQILLNLGDDIGGQTVNYTEDKGVSVGSWSVSITGENSGFKWNNYTDMDQFGIIGLDWQPVRSTFGAASAVLGADIIPDTGSVNNFTLKWNKNEDYGLSTWLDDNYGASSYDEDIYVYCSSSCFRPTAAVVDNSPTSETFTVACQSAKLNAPSENILALKKKQSIYVTNYPQGIEGLTANLYGVLFHNDTLISGTDPFLMRTGKIKNNATQDNSGNWKISMGGFTDQLKFKNTIGQFSGSLQGYFFNKMDNVTDQIAYSQYHMPLITVYEYLTNGTSNVIRQDTIEIAADYVEFSSIDGILQYIKTELNSSTSLDLIYNINEDNDLVFDDSNLLSGYYCRYVQVNGLAPYVAGIGYTLHPPDGTQYLSAMSDPVYSNFCRHLNDKIGNTNTGLVGGARIYLKDSTEVGGVVTTPIKLKPLDCFIQYDLSLSRRLKTDSQIFDAQLYYPIPEDIAGNQYLTIVKDGNSEIDIAVGAVLQLGESTEEKEGISIIGEVSAVNSDKIEFTVNTLDDGESDSSIKGMPMSFYRNSVLIDLLNNDTEFITDIELYCNQEATTIDDVRTMFDVVDKFKVKDVEQIIVNKATDIFKAILGDPSTDIGLSLGAYKTDIKNIAERGDSDFIPMIDWDSLDSLLEENEIAGTRYTYLPDSNGIDVLKLLNGLCLTNNIQQIWEYNPANRSWWMTFDEFGVDNIQTATIKGRTINELDISANELSSIVGGGWNYNKIKAEYKRPTGDDIPINVQLTNGRIGHSLKDKILTVEDKITVLPLDSVEVREDISTRFADMLGLFSQVVYNQKLILNLRKCALVSVGRYHTAEWAPIQNRQTGKRNDGALIGQVQNQNINLSNGVIDVGLLSYPSNKVGISPSLYASTVSKSSNTVTVSGLSTDPANNDFGDTSSLLTDQMYFQCIDEISGELKDRPCSCSGYRVTIFERKPTDNKLYFDTDNAYVNQNVFRGTIEKLTVDTVGTSFDITLDGNGAAFDVSKDWVVTFADRADSGLQSCQTQLYGWLSDSKNQVTDSGDNKSIGIMVN